MSPEDHAARYNDPGRRGASIEIPIGCAVCGGRRLQELLHPFDQKHDPPRWDYHVVRCAGCGFLFRHPGVRPERLGDLYASGRYAKFLGGEYARRRVRRYEATHGEPLELGHSTLRPREQRRLRATIDRGNRGMMLRAAAFPDPAGPHRRRLEEHVLQLGASAAGRARPDHVLQR